MFFVPLLAITIVNRNRKFNIIFFVPKPEMATGNTNSFKPQPLKQSLDLPKLQALRLFQKLLQ